MCILTFLIRSRFVGICKIICVYSDFFLLLLHFMSLQSRSHFYKYEFQIYFFKWRKQQQQRHHHHHYYHRRCHKWNEILYKMCCRLFTDHTIDIDKTNSQKAIQVHWTLKKKRKRFRKKHHWFVSMAHGSCSFTIVYEYNLSRGTHNHSFIPINLSQLIYRFKTISMFQIIVSAKALFNFCLL